MRLLYRFRAYPTKSQEILLGKTFGCARLVYNFGLQYRIQEYEAGNKVGFTASSVALTKLKKTNGMEFLNEVSCVPLQQELRRLDVAFSRFFSRKSNYPVFKKKKAAQSIEITKSGFQWSDNDSTLKISKVGVLKFRKSRNMPSVPTSVVITKNSCGQYHILFTIDQKEQRLASSGKVVGIDMGVKQIVVLSDGRKVNNPRFLKQQKQRIAVAQRRLARKTKGSNRYNRQRIKLAKLHLRVASRRLDFLHKLSTEIVREHDLIAVETLRPSRMTKLRPLAYAIQDTGMWTLRHFLEYKCIKWGRSFVMVHKQFPSSKMCSTCGKVNAGLTMKDREWVCACGEQHDRDHNAAKNILAAGLAVTAHGGHYKMGSLQKAPTNAHGDANHDHGQGDQR